MQIKKSYRRFLPVFMAIAGLLVLLFNYSILWHINAVDKYSQLKNSKTDNVSETDKMIDSIITNMNINEKIGQLLVVNYYGDSLENLSKLITNYSISGIMLKSENVKNKNFNSIKEINQKLLLESTRIPLIISVDQEGGNVSRLEGIIKNYPSPSELYEKKGKEGVLELADYTSTRLRELNINVNFSPVVDVVYNTNSIIYKRSFSRDGEINSALGNIYIDHFRKNHVVAVPKHFPGYGNVKLDPHESVCTDESSNLEEIAKPFLGLTSPVMVMTSHVIFQKYDTRPATMSRKVISFLRDNHYSNVIITDDIQMKSITRLYDYKEASLEALKAGCDLVLSITQDKEAWYQKAVDLHDYIRKAYENGEISEDTIHGALRRVIRMKLENLPSNQWGIKKDLNTKAGV